MRALRSSSKTLFGLHHWQEDVVKIPEVPGGPRNWESPEEIRRIDRYGFYSFVNTS